MLWRAKKESTACGIGRQSLTSQQNRLAVWAAPPLGSASRGAMDLVAGSAWVESGLVVWEVTWKPHHSLFGNQKRLWRHPE